MNRNLLPLALLAFFLIGTPVHATETQDSLDELQFVNSQVGAVTTDMALYLGWGFDDKEAVKAAAEACIKDLTEIRKRLENITVPKELNKVKEIQFKMIDKLKEMYDGIEDKDLERIQFGIIEKYVVKLSKEIEELRIQHKRNYWQDLPEDFKPIDRDIEFMKSQEDKDIYLDAMRLMDAESCKLAYENLNMLKEKYKGTILEDHIMLRISDCLLKDDSAWEDEAKAYEEGMSILQEIVDKQSYSPVWSEAFYKWRNESLRCWLRRWISCF